MGRLRVLALWLALSLCLYIPADAVDSMTSPRAGLERRTFLVLGDSYTAGYGLVSPEQDWTYVISNARNMEQLNYSISGSTFASGPQGLFPMAERCLDLPDGADPDFVLIQGSSNDYSKGIPLGEDDGSDTETFCGAVNAILDAVSQKYPDAVIVGFSSWASDDTKNKAGQIQQDYTDAMLRIFRRRGLLCYDASDTAENGMYLYDEAFRARYCLRATDWYHLSALGHAMFAPGFARWLETQLYDTDYAGQFYDLAAAPEEVRAAVSDLTGVMGGTGEHLFSPTRAATRQTLAVTLYRMAGRPSVSNRAIADMEPGTEGYTAACWAMEQGLFTPEETFHPRQPVSRQMLATVLCRFYTEVLGAPVTSLTGLGAYPDGGDAAAYAVVSLGWALQNGVLSDRDGLLRPNSTVSRGQLAVALSALRKIL